MANQLDNFICYTLGVLLAFGAIYAFGGGYYAMAGADGVPTEWLRGIPFKNYFIPGLILFIVVGVLSDWSNCSICQFTLRYAGNI